MRTIAAALLAALFTTPASALEIIDKLEACAALEPDDKRLQCYDGIVREERSLAGEERSLADIGGATVSLPPPDGWCRLDSEKLSDARLVASLSEGFAQAGNTLVFLFADCEELERWRSLQQRTLDNYASVAIDNSLREYDYPGASASFVSEVRETTEAAGQDYIEDLQGRVVEIAKNVMPTVKVGEPLHLGVIGEDANSVYTGGIMSIVTEFGDPKVSVYSTATTLLQRKIVYTHLNTLYHDAQSVPTLLNDHKKWTARLRAAN